ncbi:MAG: FprA family A-type flavoprotein [Candidatus Thermoplasmatota archaeon]
MAVRKLVDQIYEVGAEHHDRELFDELIPLPNGTSYNAYLIIGSEKTALLDTVDPSKEAKLFKNLDKLDIDEIDYIVSHHAEQDHSGSIPAVLERFPEAEVVTNSKCKKALLDHLHVPEDKVRVMENNEELSLGDKSLEFISMPWVHWPETLVTYLKEKNILFSCDFFGSHLATSNLYVQNQKKVYLSAKRYYAEIMMPFRESIKGHLAKIDDMDIDIIAPSHGPIYRDPEFILEAYEEWVDDKTQEEVIVPYVSMHGSTEKMVEHFVDYLIDNGVSVSPFNLTTTDLGQLAMSLVDASTVVIGSPTVLVGPHPKAVYAAHLFNSLRPKTRYASLIGSYGWGGRMPEQIKDSLGNFQGEFLEPVVSKGLPSDEDMKKIEELADKIIEKQKKDGLVE